MSDLSIDLGTVSIPEGHRVYKCFPGQAYRYYQVVTEKSAVFLDINDLGKLGTDPKSWDAGELSRIVRESREREEERLNARKPDRKKRSAKANQRLDARTLTLALGLYLEAKPGDLIVVPAEGYNKEVFIGELLDTQLISIELPEEEGRLSQSFLARQVRWLARRPKKDFDGKTINQLQNPTAFFDVGRQTYEVIYRLAYENYLYGEVTFSTFETSKQKFRNSDNLVTSLWFEYLIAAGMARDGDVVQFQQLSLLDATSLEWDHNLGEEMFIDIQSPGTLAFRAHNRFPVVALALWAMTMVSPDDAFAKNVKVDIRPITQSAQTCDVDVENDIREYLNTIGLERWKEACELAGRMRTQAKIHSRSKPK